MKRFINIVQSQEPLLKWAIFILLGTYFINFILAGFLIGPFDYDHLSGYYELAWRFWRSGNTLPHFNPYLCGGRPLAADPQIPIFNPLILLVPLLGATWLIKMELLAQLAVGGWGLWKLLAFYKCNEEQKVWGLFVFAAGGGIVSRFMVGHVTLGFFFLLPAFFYFLRGGNWRFYFLLTLYSCLYKPNFLIIGAPLLLMDALFRSIYLRNFRLITGVILSLFVSCLVLSVIYLPSYFYFQKFPRKDASDPLLIYWGALVSNFLIPLKAVPDPFYGFGAIQHHEFSQFLGPGIFYFAWKGFQKFSSKEKYFFLVVLLFSLWIGMGSPTHAFHPVFLFTWFRQFWPGFHSIRVTPRFWIGAYFILVFFSAIGFSFPRKKGQRLLVGFLVVLPLLANGVVNLFKPTVLAVRTQWATERGYSPISFVLGTDEDSHRYLKEGKGVLHCVENIQIEKSAFLTEGPLVKGSGTAVFTDWSTLQVESTGPMQLNLNSSQYWSFKGEGTLLEKNGLVYLMPIAEKVRGELRYRMPYISLFAWISFLSFVLVLLTIWHIPLQ